MSNTYIILLFDSISLKSEVDIDEINIAFSPRTRLNGNEQDKAFLILLGRHGAFCDFCKKTAERLVIEDKAVRESQGRSKRIRPILVIHERIKGIFHNYVVENGVVTLIPYGNCRLACYSCNVKFGSIELKDIDEKTMTWQAKKSLVRDKFINKLIELCTKHIHVCKNQMINLSSNADNLHCSQEVLVEASKQEIGNRLDLIDISNFNIKCKYCDKYFGDNKHFIIINHPPQAHQSDLDVYYKELNDATKED